MKCAEGSFGKMQPPCFECSTGLSVKFQMKKAFVVRMMKIQH